MIRTIIVDDEIHCIHKLNDLLETYCREKVQVIDTFPSVDAGLSAIPKLKPGLVFLDVQINGKTGFDLLRELGPIDFEVIFTTAYEKYAIQAFKFSAIDYLLKPIDPDDLVQAVDKASRKISKSEMSLKMDALLHNIKNMQGAKKISIPTLEGLILLNTSDIIRCQSHINYTTIYTKNHQKLTVSKTLKEFEELLTEYGFCRVHNSHLVNLAYIKKYTKGDGGRIELQDGSVVDVSRNKKEQFLKDLQSL